MQAIISFQRALRSANAARIIMAARAISSPHGISRTEKTSTELWMRRNARQLTRLRRTGPLMGRIKIARSATRVPKPIMMRDKQVGKKAGPMRAALPMGNSRMLIRKKTPKQANRIPDQKSLVLLMVIAKTNKEKESPAESISPGNVLQTKTKF